MRQGIEVDAVGVKRSAAGAGDDDVTLGGQVLELERFAGVGGMRGLRGGLCRGGGGGLRGGALRFSMRGARISLST